MEDSFLTSVHIKDTNTGDCINYNGICPESYKIGIIKTFLHRGYHISSTPELFQLEVARIKQLLTNNNFPMKLIDKTVKKFIESKANQQNNTATATDEKLKINLFFKNQMNCNYKTDEIHLRRPIDRHIAPTNEDS